MAKKADRKYLKEVEEYIESHNWDKGKSYIRGALLLRGFNPETENELLEIRERLLKQGDC